MLAASDPKAQWADPPGGGEQRAQAWQELEETLDFLEFPLEDTAAWQDTFTAGLAAPLPPPEVLARPAWKGRERGVEGDATLDKVGAVDGKARGVPATNAELLAQQPGQRPTKRPPGRRPTSRSLSSWLSS